MDHSSQNQQSSKNGTPSSCQRLNKQVDPSITTTVPKFSNKQQKKGKSPELACIQKILKRAERSEARYRKKFTKIEEKRRIPPMLKLPPELRQSVLYNVLNDAEIATFDLPVISQHLEQVCTTFETDMEYVLRQWQIRKRNLEQPCSTRTSVFDAYIAELLAPVKATSDFIKHHYKGHKKRRKHRQLGDSRRVDISLKPSVFEPFSWDCESEDVHGRTRWATVTEEEQKNALQWRAMRTEKTKEVARRRKKVEKKQKARQRMEQERKRLKVEECLARKMKRAEKRQKVREKAERRRQAAQLQIGSSALP